MNKQFATKAEILARNPFLAKHWYSRFFAGAIVTGARMDAHNWKTVKKCLYFGPVLVLIFSIDLVAGSAMSTGRRALGTTLVVYLSIAYVLVLATAYGYKHRDKINTEGALKGNFKGLWRYAFIGAAIGAASTFSGWPF